MIANNLEMRLTQAETSIEELKELYGLCLKSIEASTKVVDALLQKASVTDELLARLTTQKFQPTETSATTASPVMPPVITNDAQLEQRRQQMEAQLEQRRQQMEAQLEQRRQQMQAESEQRRQQMEAQFERQRHELERRAKGA